MLNAINRKLVFPAYMRWNHDDRLRLLKQRQIDQWKSEDELRSRQFRDFQAMLNYAYLHVPFYRQRFQALDFHPELIRKEDDLNLVPILSKKDLQENLEALLSDLCPPSQRYRDSSGGSTGHPTTFYGDLASCPGKEAAFLMTDQWTGWRLGEKSAYLWGADRDVNSLRGSRERLVLRFIYRRMLFNAFRMGEQEMTAFAATMAKDAPSLIVAYANAAYNFAQFLQRKGIDTIRPKGIVCSAETLTPPKRKLIEEVFGCKVLNRYGSREVGLMASECECQQGLHVNAAGVLLELLPMPGTPADAPHRVIVTDLQNHVMPFIRYDTGDTSLPPAGTCPCGRGLPLIGAVTGRTSDFIVHPDGRFIHGEYFSHAFYGVPGVVQFQIVQPSIDTLQIKIKTNESFSSPTKERIRAKLSEVLGGSVRIEISTVDCIEIPSSGKYRFAISHVYESRQKGGSQASDGRPA